MAISSQSVTIVANPEGTFQGGGGVGWRITFNYLPNSFACGVSADFETKPIPLTSARLLLYKNTNIDEINLSMVAVAGIANAAVDYGPGKTVSRLNLLLLDKYLKSLALPSDNDLAAGKPPATCQLIVGKFINYVGAFTGIRTNGIGPYSNDGCPTKLEIELSFMPSEFYNSNNRVGIDGGSFTSANDASGGTSNAPSPAGFTSTNSPTVANTIGSGSNNDYVLKVGNAASTSTNISSTSSATSNGAGLNSSLTVPNTSANVTG